MGLQQKWIPVLRENAPRAKSARVITMPACSHPPDCQFIRIQVRPFMPRDNDKNNDSRGRRDRPSGGKGRSGAARGPDKKFAKREGRPYAGKPDGEKSYGKKPYSGPGKPYAGKREGPPPRGDRSSDRPSHGDAPRPARFNRDDAPCGEKRPYTPRGDRSDARPAARFQDRKFGDKKPYT